ncbi:11038_t:CDS:2, partial [Dentiscutata heterogama]
FKDDKPLKNIINHFNTEKTTLTAWFKANAIYPEARGLIYADFSTHTFKEAYIALGLLQDDEEWNQCLAEAKQIQSGAQLCYLFATLLIFCNPTRPEILWKNHISALSNDILFQVCYNTGNMMLELMDANIYNRALHYLQTILNRHKRHLDEFLNMSLPTTFLNNEQINHLISEEQQYDIEELTKLIENNLLCLNIEQQAMYISIIAAMEARISSRYVKVMRLKTNMRLLQSANEPDAKAQEEFAKWLLKIGEGHIPSINRLEKDIIQILRNFVLPSQDINSLIHFVYPNLFLHSNSWYLVEYAILTSKNDYVDVINFTIMSQFSGEAVEYLSANTTEKHTESEHQYLIEFLNSLSAG